MKKNGELRPLDKQLTRDGLQYLKSQAQKGKTNPHLLNGWGLLTTEARPSDAGPSSPSFQQERSGPGNAPPQGFHLWSSETGEVALGTHPGPSVEGGADQRRRPYMPEHPGTSGTFLSERPESTQPPLLSTVGFFMGWPCRLVGVPEL